MAMPRPTLFDFCSAYDRGLVPTTPVPPALPIKLVFFRFISEFSVYHFPDLQVQGQMRKRFNALFSAEEDSFLACIRDTIMDDSRSSLATRLQLLAGWDAVLSKRFGMMPPTEEYSSLAHPSMTSGTTISLPPPTLAQRLSIHTVSRSFSLPPRPDWIEATERRKRSSGRSRSSRRSHSSKRSTSSYHTRPSPRPDRHHRSSRRRNPLLL